jgi:hypothetical protein
MKTHSQWLLFATTLLFMLSACESANIEDKYLGDKKPVSSTDEILWLPMDGNLKDSTKNDIPVLVGGKTQFVNGLNSDYGKGLYLDGSSYLLINLGYYDTLSVAFWIKGDAALIADNKPVLFDYGSDAFSAQLDATTGATALAVQKDADSANSSANPSVEYLNSFNRYSFVYVEAGGDKTKVYFKGYTSDGNEINYSDEFDFSGIVDAKSDVLYIGRSSQRENLSSTYFKGAIDEIHIYKRPLSNTEIENMALIPTE